MSIIDTNNTQTTYEFAKNLKAAGYSGIPIRLDGSKAPATHLCPSWKRYITELPSDQNLDGWFNEEISPAVGVVQGKNQELIDCDTKEKPERLALIDEYFKLIQIDFPDLYERFPIVETPTLGKHIYYRCPVETKSEKLAKLDDKEALIETKGYGGYAVGPYSRPSVHKAGRAYKLISSVPIENAPWITPEERQKLHDAARRFNKYVEPERPKYEPKVDESESNEKSPGSIFNKKGTWEFLERAGWTNLYGDAWARPGVDHISAQTYANDGRETIHVFSANADPLEEGTSYTKFSAYAFLFHDGDFSTAARDLIEQGFTPEDDRPEADLAALDRQSTEAIEDWERKKDSMPLVSAVTMLDADSDDDDLTKNETWEQHEPTSHEQHEEPQEEKKTYGLKPSELRKLKPATWLIDQHFTECSQALIYGQYNGGKSFLALDMGLCISTKKRFLGKYEVKQGPVIYVAAEGYRGYKGRLAAWEKQYEMTIADDAFRLVINPVAFTDYESTAKFIRAIYADFPDGIAAVFVDTLARNFGSGVENNAEDMAKYINNLDLVAKALNCTVITVHHKGKTEGNGPRGHSSLGGACDTIIEVSGMPKDGVSVSITKQKDGTSDIKYDLKMKHFSIPETPAGSLVLLPLSDREQLLRRLEGCTKQLAKALADTFAYRSFTWAQALEAVEVPYDIKRLTFARNLKKLTDLRFIEKEDKQYSLAADMVEAIFTLPE